MPSHEIKVRVRYVETDQMGIAHHSHYFAWLELARTSLLESVGYRYADLEREGILMPVMEASCRYRAPVKYDDELRVRCWISEVRRFKVEFQYEIFREDEVLATEGKTTLAFLNREGKPSRLPEKLQTALEKFMEN